MAAPHANPGTSMVIDTLSVWIHCRETGNQPVIKTTGDRPMQAQMPDSVKGRPNWQLHALLLCILLVFSGTLHFIYNFGGVYGEQDSARLVVDALIWAKTGIRSVAISEYRYFVSPGYIYLAKLAYELSRITPIGPEVCLSFITNLAAVLLFVPAYFLFSNLIGPIGAFVACLYLELIPSFWYVGLYGFPTTIALCLVIIALLLWDLFLTDRVFGRAWLHLGLILTIALLAMLMKADVWTLSIPAFFGIALVRRGFAKRPLALSALISVGVILVAYGISHALMQNAPEAAAYASNWSHRYSRAQAATIGSTPPTLIDALRLYVMSVGIGTLPIVGIALLVLLFNRQRALAAAIAFWLPASFLFWAWRPGDSSRHHVPAALPAALAVGALVAYAGRYRYLVYLFLAAVIAVDYVRYPTSDSPLSASGRLLETAKLSRQEIAKIQDAAADYVASSCNAVLLGAPLLPYAEAALLLRANQVELRVGEDHGYPVREFVYDWSGHSCRSTEVIVVNRASAAQALRVFRSQGRPIYSLEFGLTANGGQLVMKPRPNF